MKNVIGLFDTAENAFSAQNELLAAGIARDRISIVTAEAHSDYLLTSKTGPSEASEGAATGAMAGGAAGLLAGLGLLAIPGIGLLALGPILAALTGASVGAAAGGLIGGLVGHGIPEHEAEIYNEGIQRGGTLLTIESPEPDVERIAMILSQHHAIDIEKRAAEWETAGWQRRYSAPPPPAAFVGSLDSRTRGLERGADAAGSIRQSTGTPEPHADIGTTRHL